MENQDENEKTTSADGMQDPKHQLDDELPPAGDKKRWSDGKIFGVNFLIFIGYSGLCAATVAQGGMIFDAFFLIAHLIISIILAGVYRRWAWGVSGLVAFLIGVSTCAGLVFR